LSGERGVVSLSAVRPVIQLLRWHRPVGALLLFFPCWWGMVGASHGTPPWEMVCLLGAGAMLMRSAGCILNDWADQDIDRQVARTRTRPLACGALSSRAAFVLLAGVLLVSLGVVSQLPPLSQGVAFGFAAASVAYPWMKRLTFWPQAYLGLLFSSGVWVGWIGVERKPLSPSPFVLLTPWMLYGAGVVWTVVYDTLYAYQDVRDDGVCGVKSSALALGPRPQKFFMKCAIIQLILWSLIGLREKLPVFFWIGLGIMAVMMVLQIKFFKPHDPHRAKLLFDANVLLGMVMGLSLWWGFEARGGESQPRVASEPRLH